MSDAKGECPSSETLEGIAAGQIVAADMTEHVAACPACSATLQRIRDDNRFLADFMPQGPLPPNSVADSHAEIGIPGYEITRELHRGGQGIVYQAVQRSTRRVVAIKVMRQGHFASAAERARFAREIESLGKLDHPNIVAVHDAGTVDGLHYFVMDYVDGLPLDEAVAAGPATASDASDDRLLGVPPARLEPALAIFVKVCEAVHAAHLRGIMHRDLKPSNIRVDREDEPHVLDFGLAKPVEEDDTAMTRTGQFVGSLPWASPEQIQGSSTRIDLRSDIYSLGAILYQLLTGRVPFDVSGSLQDALDAILHRDPPQPSVIAAARGLRIDHDLETIVLKCLSKERERRYQGAGELAGDLRRYLAGEVIDARRDSAWYVLRKTAWRKRRVFTAIAIPMLLFPFALYAYHLSTLATRQAEMERKLRQVETERNAAMLEITRRLQARPGSDVESPGGRLGVLNVEAIQNDLDAGSLPVSDHGVALLLAETLRDRGRIVDAEGLLRRAIYMLQREQGQHHPEIGRMRTMLVDLLLRRGTRIEDAQRMAELAVKELTEAFGAGPETARGWIVLSRVRLARGDNTGALDAVRQALTVDSDPMSIQHVRAQATLARVRAYRGENEDARREFLGALRNMLLLTHDTDARLLDTLELGAEMIERGVVEADELLDSTVLRGASAGLSPPAALQEVAAVLRGGADGTARDDHILAARLAMVAMRERLLGADHPSLGASLASAGWTAYESAMAADELDLRRIEEAAMLFRRALPLQIALHGPDSPLVGKTYERLATCAVTLCRLREASQWFVRDCELWMRQPAELRDDYQILIRSRWTAWHATRAGEYELGLEWTERTLSVLDRTFGRDDGGAALVFACRALCLAGLARTPEARASIASAMHVLNTGAVPDDQRIECGRLLALAHLSLGELEMARTMMEPAWEAEQPVFEQGDPSQRLEWSQTMQQYCRAFGDIARAAQFERCLSEEAVGDYQLVAVESEP